MSRLNSLRRNTLMSIVLGRWEPVMVVLAISALIHGLWLLFPDWTVAQDSITGASRIYEQTIGGMLTAAGAIKIFSMAAKRRVLLRHISLISFVLWGFLAWLAVIAGGLTGIIWIPYMTIMAVSALVYLNVSVGAINGD